MSAGSGPSDRLAAGIDTIGDAIAAVPGVVFAYLFGSRSTGRIDAEQVVRILSEDLGDLIGFKDVVLRLA